MKIHFETIYCLTACFIQIRSALIRDLTWNEELKILTYYHTWLR